jgi:hypothetical protein
MSGRAVAFAALLVSATGWAAPLVSVVPFTGTGDDLAIYAKPTADAVAKGLAGLPGGAKVAAPGQKTLLTLELRAIPVDKGVRLEGVIRRPQVGGTLGRVSAGPVPLADLDRASADLARRARRAIERDLAKRARPPSTPTNGQPPPAPLDPLAGLVEDDEEVAKPAPKIPPVDNRPLLLVTSPDGELGADANLARGLGTAAVTLLGRDLGFRVVRAPAAGILTPRSAAEEARRAGAKGALMIRILGIRFAWRGAGQVPVLLAKGKIRIALVDGTGTVRYDEVLTTDTLVGSRGDEEGALTRFVLRQATDAVRPDLQRKLNSDPL